MGKGKPRHNNENQLNKPCNKIQQWGGKCFCYDGEYTHPDGHKSTILESAREWCNPDGENGCKCNPYMCNKMMNKWFASLSDKKKKDIQERNEPYKSDFWTKYF